MGSDKKIARRGRHILQEYSVDPLELIQAGEIMTRAPATLSGDLAVSEVLAFFRTNARYRSYPGVDSEGGLLGMVSRSDALRWQGGETPESATLAETQSDASQPFAHPESPIGMVADLIIQTGIGRIPITEAQTRRVIGIVSRHDLLKARSAQRTDETRRERFLSASGANPR